MLDWIKALSGYSQEAISAACDEYIRREKKRRPTPADILSLIGNSRTQGADAGTGDRNSLSVDERRKLETEILPRARRLLDVPGLSEHARKTLAFWGEQPKGNTQ